jgi:glycerophosphoryl diester phosphodiesterase
MSQPVWISHRGYCRDATENTAEAFRAALALGFTHLETDLRSTADGQLVLAHDMELSRISDSVLNIGQTASDYLRRVTLNGGERLLFMDEFLPEFSDYHWIFDIKPEYGLRTIDLLLQWWQKPEYADFFSRRVRFLFWQKKQQNYLLQHKPDAQCMARVGECRRAGLACWLGFPMLAGIRSGVAYALPLRLAGQDIIRPDVVASYRERGARVLAYLPENDKQAQHTLVVGVDEILTNDAPLG